MAFKKVTVSIEPTMFRALNAMMQTDGITKRSVFVTQLIREEAKRRGMLKPPPHWQDEPVTLEEIIEGDLKEHRDTVADIATSRGHGNVLPAQYCAMLDIGPGSTYRDAALALLDRWGAE